MIRCKIANLGWSPLPTTRLKHDLTSFAFVIARRFYAATVMRSSCAADTSWKFHMFQLRSCQRYRTILQQPLDNKTPLHTHKQTYLWFLTKLYVDVVSSTNSSSTSRTFLRTASRSPSASDVFSTSPMSAKLSSSSGSCRPTSET